MDSSRGASSPRDRTPGPEPRFDAQSLLDDDAAARRFGAACGLEHPEDAGRLLRGIAGQGVTFDLLGDLCTRLESLLPAVADPDRVLAALGRLIAVVPSPLSTATLFQRDPAALETLLQIFSAGPHLADVVIADPASWEEVRVGQGRPESREALRDALGGALAGHRDAEGAMLAMRRFKRREMLRIAYGDLVSGQPLETVTRQLSRVADALIDTAVRLAVTRLEAERGTPRGPGGERAVLSVIALGKLGGEELNYSSDIDLVFVSSLEGRVAGPKPCTNQEFFERVVREVVRLLAEPTPVGSGHRVDLRLRPHGATGPLVLPLDATLRYYDREARTWERQAWVKARCAGGDAALGEKLLAALTPWVYRRWLSASDISEIKALKRRMERKVADEGRAEFDVKLGSGGIRDIEYAIQFLQLLGGGDTPAVRTGNTIEAIRRLTEAGALTDQERAILERNYRLLRKVEHRLQILSDAQTHTLPVDERELGRLAVRAGYDPGPEGLRQLRDDLAESKTLNRRILDHLLHDAFPDDGATDPETDLVLDPRPIDAATRELFLRHGFRDPDTARLTFQSLSEERARFLSTRRCRHFLAAIAPRLLATLGRTPDPDATLLQLAAVADSLGGKGVLWELFSFNPPSLDLTVQLCASSPFLAGILVGNPGMIDELLDSLVVERLPTPAALDDELAELCHAAVDISPIVHTFKVSEQLRVGVREVLGRLDTEATTTALTAIAETVLRAVVSHEQARLVERLGKPTVGDDAGDKRGATAEALIVAMGKFGGREINYRSDLDVVFLYDHDGVSVPVHPDGRSAGSTSNAHFFAELAQRTMKACTTLAPQGRLYEVDSRLRPSGRAGAVAVSLDELARWFAPDGPAAVWERQALLKARPVIGGGAARERFAAIRAAAIWGRDWSAADIAEIRHNRLRMEQGATVANLKRGPGGVVDIEFLVQVLQLVHGADEPRLQTPETLAGLVALHDNGVVSTDSFAFLSDAYRLLRRIEGRLQLLGAKARHDFPPPGDDRRTLARLMGYEREDDLAAEVTRTTARVRREFDAVFNRETAAPG